VDVNLHLLRVLGRGSATDYYTSFIALGEARVLPSDLAERLAPSAGVRNRLIHEYDDIDDAVILGRGGGTSPFSEIHPGGGGLRRSGRVTDPPASLGLPRGLATPIDLPPSVDQR